MECHSYDIMKIISFNMLFSCPSAVFTQNIKIILAVIFPCLTVTEHTSSLPYTIINGVIRIDLTSTNDGYFWVSLISSESETTWKEGLSGAVRGLIPVCNI